MGWLRLAPAVAQGEICHSVDVRFSDMGSATPGRMGTGRAQPDQIRPQTVDPGGKTTLGDQAQTDVIQIDARQ